MNTLYVVVSRNYSFHYFFPVLKNHIPGSRKPSAIASGYDHSPPKGVRCPTCGEKSEIPNGGISAFPPNYPLQHKMVLATINSRSTHLLCDICTADVSVSFPKKINITTISNENRHVWFFLKNQLSRLQLGVWTAR